MNEPTLNPRGEPQSVPAPQNGPLTLRDRVQSLRLPDRPPPKRSLLSLIPWVLCLLFLSTTVAMALRNQPAQLSEAESAAKRDREVSTSQAGQSSLERGAVMLESKGYIVPLHQIQVSPKVGGMVMSLRFEEGMVVQKGSVLAVLEKIEYLADRDRTAAQVSAYKSRWEELSLSLDYLIRQAESDLTEAKAQYQSEFVQLQSEINARDGVSAVDVLKRRATVEAKKARMEWQQHQRDMVIKGFLAQKVVTAKAEWEQWQAELTKAEWRLSNCVITAPVTGVILTKRAEEGSLVNPSAFSNGLSASICDMADLGQLEVDLSIPERDVARLIAFRLEHPKAQKCQVRADAFPKRVFEGYVSRIMPTADQSKAAVPVRVKIVVPSSEAGVYLRPQMNAAVTFLNEESETVVLLPGQGFGSPPVGDESKGK